MKTLLRNLSFGLVILLVSFSMVSPTLAQNNKDKDRNDRKEDRVKIKANANLRSLSQFTLATGELTAKTNNTLTIKLNHAIPKGNRSEQYRRGDTITVVLSAETIFSRNDFSKGTAAELTVGDIVQVFGRLDAQGRLSALSVKDTSLQLTTQALVGTISALDPQARTITLVHRSGFSHKWLPLTVYVNDKTLIRDQNRQPITFADIQLNQEARVDGVLNTRNNTIVATRLKATVVAAPQPLPFSLKGAVTAISSTELPAQVTVKVSDVLPPLEARARAMTNNSIDLVTFTVDAKTKFTTQAGATISLKDITVGDTLVVQASMDASGHITATIVRNESVQAATSFEGTVGSLNATAKTFVLTKADGSTVQVSVQASTALSVAGVANPTFADLQAGYKATVKGTFNTRTNVLTATSVSVAELPQPLPFSLKGTVVGISGTSFPARLTVLVNDVLPPLEMNARALRPAPINLVTVEVNANTRLTNKSGGAINLASLTLGDSVVVQGSMDSSGKITATIVRNDSLDVTVAPLSGTIKSVNASASTFTFASAEGRWYTAHVLGTTFFSVPGVTNATFANLAVGNQVNVSGTLNSNTYLIHATNVSVTATTTASSSVR